MWAAISGPCTDKQQGDRKAARWANNTSNNCGSTANSEYSTANYEYYIELPPGRSYATDVIIFAPNFNCGNTTTNEQNPGGNPSGCPGSLNTTFTLYQADNTAIDDTDNPPMNNTLCGSFGAGQNGTKTFNVNTIEKNYTFNPSPGNFTNFPTSGGLVGWWRLCRISAGAPSGKYILRVNHGGGNTQGSNAYSVVATPSSPQRLCDSRTDATCPRVYAKDYLSIYAGAPGSAAVAAFFLAEIGTQHDGKKVEITLWDPAEGATQLRILAPTGANTWAPRTFDYTSSYGGPGGAAGPSGTGVSAINVSAFNFNHHLITITFTLPTAWNPPATNSWFKIEYTYGASSTDRTTWAVRVLGDPVHLID
jgi:hypothetical protein